MAAVRGRGLVSDLSAEHVREPDRDFRDQEHQSKPEQLEHHERADGSVYVVEADIAGQCTLQPEQDEPEWRREIGYLNIHDEKCPEPELVDAELLDDRNEKRRT